jgi:hypothetical protein
MSSASSHETLDDKCVGGSPISIPQKSFKLKIEIAAREYSALGWIPLSLRGKIPITKAWTAITTNNWIGQFVSSGNIGLRTGPESRLIIIDIDVKDNGVAYWNNLIDIHDDIDTVKVETGSGGFHYYFVWDERAAMLTSRSRCINDNGLPIGIDIKARGGQVVAPPSIHPDTHKEYRFHIAPEDINNELLPIPDWLFKLLVRPKSHHIPAALYSAASCSAASCSAAPRCITPATALDNLAAEVIPLSTDIKPLMDDNITVDGVARKIDFDLLKEVLYYIECPTDVSLWGGYLQNIKSLVRSGVARQHNSDVYDIFDDWCKSCYNYDKNNNLSIWHSSQGSGDFRTMIGIAVKNGLRRAKHDVLHAMANPESHFYLRDLINMADSDPVELDQVKEAMIKCMVYILSNSNQVAWLCKIGGLNPGEFSYGMSSNLSKLNEFKFNIIGMDKPIPLPILANKFRKSFMYNGICNVPYQPGTPPPDYKYFNIFPGFASKPEMIDFESVQLILDHILEVWCSNDENLYKYVLSWFASLVQTPTIKPKTVLVLLSIEGAGKNVITDFIGNCVFGNNLYLCTPSVEKVLGKFSGVIQGRKLIVLNEIAIGEVSHEYVNATLKSRVTETQILIERKGFESEVISDCAGYMLLSNMDNPVRISRTDRRFVVIEVSPKRVGDIDYFTQLHKIIEKPETACSFMHYLMNYDLKGWNVTKIPETQIRRNLKRTQLPSTVRYILEIYDSWDQITPQTIECSVFYTKYRAWCDLCGEKVETMQTFGRHLKSNFNIDRFRKREGEQRIYVYELDYNHVFNVASTL